MQNCLGELNLTYALIYLDDMIVFSRTEEEHLHRLRVVFSQFLEHGLKLKPSKCHFLQDEITFLGHEISADGMKPGTANLKAIAEMAPLKTYTEIRRFTGMTGFFRQFIKGYSRIAKPLNDLLEGEASKLKNEELELMPEAFKAFEELKMRCMTVPILVFADFKKPFCLETNASKVCKLFNRHARVLNRGKTWHSVSYEGSPCEEYIEEACDVHLLYLAKDTIAELRKKTVGVATSSNPTTVTSTARPLGLHNLPLPDVPLPTLPDETAASEEPSKIVPLQEYVTTVGSIVPLPQDALHIPENLTQSDNIIEDQMDAPNDGVTDQTKACLIKLRKISQIEISMWQKPKLPDETNSGTRNVNGNYNLREKKVENKHQSSRPQRMTTKPPPPMRILQMKVARIHK